MKFKKLLSAVAATAIAAGAFTGMAVTASAATTTVTYALAKDDAFTSGDTVAVKNGDTTVATITYGVSGGAAFKAAKSDSHVEGYTAFTEGNGSNGTPDGGTLYIINPEYAGTIEVCVVLNGGKAFYILEDGTALKAYNGITKTEKYYGTFSFDVKAGSSYKVYCTGSKLGFYGFKYEYSTAATHNVSISAADGQSDYGTIAPVTTAAEGSTVTIQTTPVRGYAFDRIEVYDGDVNISSNVGISGNTFVMPSKDVSVKVYFKQLASYAVTVNSGSNGSAVAKTGETVVTNAYVGEEITISATPDAGYQVDTISSGDVAITGGKFTMPDKSVTVAVAFKKMLTATFSKGDDPDVQGTAPEALQGESITIPKNYTLYKEGYTMTGWSDGTNTYSFGQTIDMSGNLNLTPVFVSNNGKQPAGRVAFDLRKVSGAPVIQIEGSSGFFVAQSTNGVDVKLDYTTNPGKINNSSWDDCLQINNGTTFSIPVKAGTRVRLGKAFNNSAENLYTVDGTTINGTGAEYYTTKITEDKTVSIVYGSTGSYYYNETITIIYPVKAVTEETTWSSDFFSKLSSPITTETIYDTMLLSPATVNSGNSNNITVSSNKLKLPKKGSNDQGYVAILPGVAGTVKVNYTINDSRNLFITQEETSASDNNKGEVSLQVVKDKEVHIYTDNTNGTLEVASITFTPEQAPSFTGVEAEGGMFKDKEGAAAAAYSATVDFDDYTVPTGTLKWELTRADMDTKGYLDAKHGALSGSVQFGLIIKNIPNSITITGAKLIIVE